VSSEARLGPGILLTPEVKASASICAQKNLHPRSGWGSNPGLSEQEFGVVKDNTAPAKKDYLLSITGYYTQIKENSQICTSAVTSVYKN